MRTLCPAPASPHPVLVGRSTPGVGGYLLVHLLCSSFVFLPYASVALFSPWSGDPVGVLLEWVFALMWATAYAAIFGAPAALIGVVVLHRGLRRVAEQWVHVLAFWVAGGVVGVLYDRVLLAGWYPWLWLSLAVASATARACVIPLVRRAS